MEHSFSRYKMILLVCLMLTNVSLFGKSLHWLSYNRVAGDMTLFFMGAGGAGGYYADNFSYTWQDSTKFYTVDFSSIKSASWDPDMLGVGFSWTKVVGEKNIKQIVSVGPKIYSSNSIPIPTVQASYTFAWILGKNFTLQCGTSLSLYAVLNLLEVRAGLAYGVFN